MSTIELNSTLRRPAMAAYLLGVVDYELCLALQNRLVYEAGGSRDGQITLIVCEHPDLITVGRQGSTAHIQLSGRELTTQGLEVRWINRGGGCVLHRVGQLAVYTIVPLESNGLSVGDFQRSLQTGLTEALIEVGFACETHRGQFGVWGRKGQVVQVGCAVKNWVSYHGAFINVSPTLDLYRHVQTDPFERRPMSSLVAELRRPVKMTAVREAVVRHLAAAWGCQRYHVYGSHPLLVSRRPTAEPQVRVG